ncbi:MAG: RagB/SusD family nutrient uptake outer membrane protein [Prevotellaceae bacterium]|nr:RagB/SusD family nutrient uptake outer membrane protein [Prevotellaceae bacterium]
MKTNTIKILWIALCTFALTACLDIDTPPYDRESDLTFWNDPQSALQSLNACYEYLPGTEEILYSDAATDNAYCKVQDFTRDIANGAYSPSYHYVKTFWDTRYRGIKRCNRLLANIDKVPGLSGELRNQYIGEAKTIRAWHYFELYSRFGDIPYYTHVITMSEAATISRTPKADVVAAVIEDLDEVIANDYLPTSYPAEEKGRVTRWATQALKARILLFEGQWNALKTVTENIMNNSGHALFNGGYDALFTVAGEGNPEIILDVQYAKGLRENRTQSQFLPPSLGGYSQLSPLQELVDSYPMINGKAIHENGSGYDAQQPYTNRDPRLAATIAYNGNSYKMVDGSLVYINTTPGVAPDGFGFSSNVSATGYYLKKYWDNDYRASLLSGLNTILIRYADVLLMHAEACAETGSLNAAEWNRTIKLIRARAGFNHDACEFPSGKTNSELIQIIRNERRCELAFEGLRIKDIYRWRIAENVLNGWCHGIYTGETIGTDNGFVRIEQRHFLAGKNYLWPIPQADRDVNKNLSTNPDW